MRYLDFFHKKSPNCFKSMFLCIYENMNVCIIIIIEYNIILNI